MTVLYDPSPSTDCAYDYGSLGVASTCTGFLHLDQMNKASLWWGQQLLRMWYYNLMDALSQVPVSSGTSDGNTINRMRVYLAPTESGDITDYDLFNITGWYDMGDGQLWSMQDSGSVPMSASPGDIDIGFQLDHFAKIFYSTILSDLGQAKGPNILSDAGLMQEYVVAGYSNWPLTGFNTSTPPEQAFNQVMASTGNLTITPSTFYSQYICQVPHRRDMGSVIIAVLVADIVFLQALFQLLTYATTWWLKRTDKTANHCEGCQRQLAETQAQPEGVALLQLTPKASNETIPMPQT